MQNSKHKFGGKWTEEKLKHIKKYLSAYATIMNRRSFRFAYIDAFAGTGYRTINQNKQDDLLFPELTDNETKNFIDGSARIALQVQPRFTKYIFIERDSNKIPSLEGLRKQFPSLENDIAIVNQDANSYLQELCLRYSWKNNRAVLFLDPYGMQVHWKTIEAIANTRAIDLWLLFPLGVAVNRLLKKNGEINTNVRKKLYKMFGTSEWFEYFYCKKVEQTLFSGTKNRENM